MPKDARDKPRLYEAMKRAGVSQGKLARAAGVPVHVVTAAVYSRVSAEKAGVVCRTLGELASLSAPEKRAVFRELVTFPKRSEELIWRVSTEDPMENLWDF